MWLWVALAVFAVIIAAFILNKPAKNFPPGPIRWPLASNLFNGPIPGLHSRFVAGLRDTYGPIVGFKNLGVSFVITQEPKITEELFVKNGSKVNAKPSDAYLDGIGGKFSTNLNETTGIAMTDGDRWRENRRFAVMTVFGADKIRKLDHKVQPEIADFLSWLDHSFLGAERSAVVSPHEILPIVTLNVIGSICADVRPNPLGHQQDPDVTKFAQNIIKMMQILGSSQSIGTVLNRTAAIARSVQAFGFPSFVSLITEIRQFTKKLAQERESDIKAYGLPEIPTILDLLVAGRLQDPEFANVELDHLVGIMTDIFAGGTDTTAVTLNWIICELVNNPDIRRRLIEEIDIVVGTDRPINHDDLPLLPLLDAVVHETLRHHPIVTLSAPALVEEPISLQDGKYEIPAGAWAMPNIWGMQHDPAYWDEPMAWKPQRWIDSPDLKKSAAFVPFKLGMRTCIGRFLAIVEMKFVLASLFQRFDVEHPDGSGHHLDLTEDDMSGISKPPVANRIRIVRRH